MASANYSKNYINGKFIDAADKQCFDKVSPATGQVICKVARSGKADVLLAIDAASKAQADWAATNVVARGNLMREVALKMMDRKTEIASIVAAETGKALSHAAGEVDAAVEMGMFVAGEGRRYYGRTTTSSTPNRTVMVQRQPLGIAALIIASNTPIANVAWKAFPSMFCGNASIMKPSEDTPATAGIFAEICEEVGIPPGVFNVIHGFGTEAGMPLVESADVDLVSFTGSCDTGRIIQRVAGERLAKVCMELGGKNALVVCDDADLDNACKWVLSSSFSNAGQRCAASSRIIIFESIYDEFRNMLIDATKKLSIGSEDGDYLGPVINKKHLQKLVASVKGAVSRGAKLSIGGDQLTDKVHADGFYMLPTILEDVDLDDDISQRELFGPVTILYKVRDIAEALDLANNSNYGLTSSIHTASIHRAMKFSEQIQAGVVVINGGTHGSEPHMGFGGVKNSGTGWREAGVEAMDVYSDIKYINIIHDPEKA